MRQQPTHAIFDLDGTLADSSGGILASFRATLDELSMEVSDDTLRTLIGPPLWGSFRQLGVADELLDDAVATYRGHYERIGVSDAVPYVGVREVLEALHAQGVHLGVATAKRVDFAKIMLTNFGFDHLFDIVAGSSISLVVNEKYEIIDEVLRHWQGAPTASTWMVGDRKYDVAGALGHGVIPIGVTWGFGTAEELERAGAAFVVDSPEALLGLSTMDVVKDHGNSRG